MGGPSSQVFAAASVSPRQPLVCAVADRLSNLMVGSSGHWRESSRGDRYSRTYKLETWGRKICWTKHSRDCQSYSKRGACNYQPQHNFSEFWLHTIFECGHARLVPQLPIKKIETAGEL